VTVTRLNGFTGSVTLNANGLPSGATASWKLGNGTSSNVVPPSLNSATLKIQTSASTPNASSQPLITATSGNLTHTTTISLVVQPATQPNFALTTSPASQTLLQGDVTTFRVDVNRSGGFSGAVGLSVSGLPKGTKTSWTPSNFVSGAGSSTTLEIEADKNAQTGTYALTITGTGAISGSTVSRSAAVTLTVETTKSFEIEGNLGLQLSPGRRLPLNVSLTNPYNFDLRIMNLAVAVEQGTTKPECGGTQNFRATPIPAARYPITLPAGATRTLTQLGVADADKPQVEMVDHSWNQDVCKGATITLAYNGTAGK
jgi:hypothetical protein